jgi:hypothetical protein
MLASITPLGERGRHSRWGITIGFFLLGSTSAGVLAGALSGALGAIVLPASVGVHARLLALAIAILAAIALDARPHAVPGPRRQVDERWLHQYRGWVYGLGYGTQLGLAVTTVVSSAATYVALWAAFLTAGPGAGALIVGCYGAIRGLTPLLAVRVRSPQQLLALHARLARTRDLAAHTGLVLLTAILALAVAGSLV